MSLLLSYSTPRGLEIKTHPKFITKNICLGDYEINLRDFLAAVEYVLTNTDLEPRDPRLAFIKKIAEFRVIEGHAGGNSRRLSF